MAFLFAVLLLNVYIFFIQVSLLNGVDIQELEAKHATTESSSVTKMKSQH